MGSIFENFLGQFWLPTYLAKADGFSLEMDKLDWWRKNENELPLWSKACKTVLLVQPSSAAG